jgi:outer membrane protein OmpA-like peptidoglycan-associated protein
MCKIGQALSILSLTVAFSGPAFAKSGPPQSPEAFAQKVSLSASDRTALQAKVRELYPQAGPGIVCEFKPTLRTTTQDLRQVTASIRSNQLIFRFRTVEKKLSPPAFVGGETIAENWEGAIRNLQAAMADDQKQGYQLQTIDFRQDILTGYKLTKERFYSDLEKLGIRSAQIRFKKQDLIYSYLPVPVHVGIESHSQYLLVTVGLCKDVSGVPRAGPATPGHYYERVRRGEKLTDQELKKINVPNLYVKFKGGEDYFEDKTAAYEEIKNVVAYILATGQSRITLSGHTGGDGGPYGSGTGVWNATLPVCGCSFDGMNYQSLMVARAETVKNVMIKLGVRAEFRILPGSHRAEESNRRVSVEYK